MYILHLALILRCQCPSVCLSVTEVNWRIITFQIPIQIYRALSLRGGVISTTTSRAMLATARPCCIYYARYHNTAQHTASGVKEPLENTTKYVRVTKIGIVKMFGIRVTCFHNSKIISLSPLNAIFEY